MARTQAVRVDETGGDATGAAAAGACLESTGVPHCDAASHEQSREDTEGRALHGDGVTSGQSLAERLLPRVEGE